MRHTRFQPNVKSHSGEKIDFIDFAILTSAAIFDS